MIKRLATKEMQSAVFLLQIVADGCIVENGKVTISAEIHSSMADSTVDCILCDLEVTEKHQSFHDESGN